VPLTLALTSETVVVSCTGVTCPSGVDSVAEGEGVRVVAGDVSFCKARLAAAANMLGEGCKADSGEGKTVSEEGRRMLVSQLIGNIYPAADVCLCCCGGVLLSRRRINKKWKTENKGNSVGHRLCVCVTVSGMSDRAVISHPLRHYARVACVQSSSHRRYISSCPCTNTNTRTLGSTPEA